MALQERPILVEMENDLQAEIMGFRQDLLQSLPILTIALGWAWFWYAVVWQGSLGQAISLAGILSVCGYVARRHMDRHNLAAGIVLIGLILGQSTLIVTHHALMTLAVGSLIVVLANAVLSAMGASLTVILLVIANLLASLVFSPTPWNRFTLGEAATAYILALGLSWLVLRPMRQAAESALAGWEQSREHLAETRERRMELSRALRALEEATYRIERTNNELVIAQHQAEQAKSLQNRFTATVSHELRGPLNVIVGFTQLMALSPESYGEELPSCYRSDIYTIYRNSRHLSALVDDILDLSQVEAYRLSLVREPLDMGVDVVQDAVGAIEPLLRRKGLFLRQEMAEGIPSILADPVRMRQVMLNLLANAVRFTDEGGVTVSLTRASDQVKVSVTDTGHGIPAEHMDELFVEFHQIQPTETREARGTGLGLAISKHLVELHGGRMWAESAEGRGTTFNFTLPVAEGDPDLVRTPHDDRDVVVHETCIVVHDDLTVVRALGRRLEGLRTIGLDDVANLASLTDELHPQAIITSPEHLAETRAVLKDLAYDVPVICLRLPYSATQSPLQGVTGYLSKPVSPESLAAMLRRACSLPNTNILLVEDDLESMRLMERMLTALPREYCIRKARNGRQALDIMASWIPDVVLLDLVMPEMNGSEALSRMRDDESLCDVPVIIVSAQQSELSSLPLAGPLQVHFDRALGIDRGADCLRSIMEHLEPSYSTS